jgi:hypothetical protein
MRSTEVPTGRLCRHLSARWQRGVDRTRTGFALSSLCDQREVLSCCGVVTARVGLPRDDPDWARVGRVAARVPQPRLVVPPSACPTIARTDQWTSTSHAINPSLYQVGRSGNRPAMFVAMKVAWVVDVSASVNPWATRPAAAARTNNRVAPQELPAGTSTCALAGAS